MHAHVFTIWHLIGTALGTAGVQRVLVEVVSSMPPLPANATWFQKWLYAAAHAIATPSTKGST